MKKCVDCKRFKPIGYVAVITSIPTATKGISMSLAVVGSVTIQIIMNLKQSDMKRILDLPLKAKWYEMQESGEKTEEYREIKPYWVKRLCPCTHECSNGHWSEKYNKCVLTCKAVESHMNHYYNGERIGVFTHVRFRYGYTKRTFTHKIDSITIGRGKPEWGAPTDRDVFIIKHQK